MDKVGFFVAARVKKGLKREICQVCAMCVRGKDGGMRSVRSVQLIVTLMIRFCTAPAQITGNVSCRVLQHDRVYCVFCKYLRT